MCFMGGERRRSPNAAKVGTGVQATWNAETLAPACDVANRRSNVHSLLPQPNVQVGWVEPHESSYLEERDPTFADQALNVARGDAQYLGNAVDVDQR
jgi:hypothetical protein